MKFKIKFNLKLNFRKIVATTIIILVVALVTFAVYGYYQFVDLRNDFNSVKGNLSDSGLLSDNSATDTESTDDSSDSSVVYKVLSHETKTLRIEDPNNTDYTNPTYIQAKVMVVRMKVTNNTDLVFDSNWSINARTSTGSLVSTATLHPDDEKDARYPSLAPGGSFEANYYYVEDGQTFTGLYDTVDNKSIDF